MKRSKSGSPTSEQSSPAETSTASSEAQITKHQTFTFETVNRDQLIGADYNPRKISEDAKQRLKAALKTVGLVQPIVWNKQTGRIVGGHQRITQLDSLEGSSNYKLTVAVVDVDEKLEKEINVLLNNPEAQGDWDLEKLKTLLKGEDFELEAAGFDNADMFKLFGFNADEEINKGLESLGNQIEEAKNRYGQMLDGIKEQSEQEFYCVLVFKNQDARWKFTEWMGLTDDRYIDGGNLTRLVRHKIESRDETSPEDVKVPEEDTPV